MSMIGSGGKPYNEGIPASVVAHIIANTWHSNQTSDESSKWQHSMCVISPFKSQKYFGMGSFAGGEFLVQGFFKWKP